MSLVTVYHPVTNESFEVPHQKSVDLRLNHGWNSHPFEVAPPAPVAEPVAAPEPTDTRAHFRGSKSRKVNDTPSSLSPEAPEAD